MNLHVQRWPDTAVLRRYYTRFFLSPLWYGILILAFSTVQIFFKDHSLRINLAVLNVALLVSIGRICIPVFFDPPSWLTRGWICLALTWACVVIVNTKDIFFPQEFRIINQIIYFSAYIPYGFFIASCFIRFEFQQRTRYSLLIDTLIISVTINITSYVLLKIIIPQITFINLFFFSMNFSIVYSLYLIFTQKPKQWRALFHYVSLCLLLIALIDLLWAIKEGLNIRFATAPFYALVHVLFAKAPMIPIYKQDDHKTKLFIDSLFQQTFPYSMIILAMVATIITGYYHLSVSILGLLMIKAAIQSHENVQLLRKLDKARFEANEMRGLLLSSIHDIRDPITASTGMIAALEKMGDDFTGSQRRFLSILKHNIHKINDQMHDLLDISGSQRDEIMSERVKVNDVLAHVKRQMEAYYAIRREGNPYLPPADISISTISDPVIRGKARVLERILMNLVKNSLENTASHVEITATIEDQMVVLTVADNGPGYPAAILKHGIRVGFSSRAEGYGFGLAGVAANVRVLHGSILIKNQAGATTIIRFPCADGEDTGNDR